MEILRTVTKENYIIRTVRYAEGEMCRGSKPFEERRYCNRKGDWISNDPRFSLFLLRRLHIWPELAERWHRVCSIGKSHKDGKWYGWSHRAIEGFDIGDKLFTIGFREAGFEQLPYTQRGFKTIETEDEARQAAKNFAEHVT